jgi:hypothetical protein
VASGFSQITGVPAASTASAISAWVLFGVQMCTTSTSSAAASSAIDPTPRSAPSTSTARAVASGVRPVVATTTPPAARTACACTAPMNPAPTIAARIRGVIVTSSGPARPPR